jgi:hypothetical protein
MHEGDNPRDRDADADRPFRTNLDLAKNIRDTWRDGKLDSGATSDLLKALRSGSSNEVCPHVVELLNRGVAPQSIWDALHLGAGELLARQPGIASLHAVTSTNALRYAYETSGDDHTRRLLMLQNAAFLPMFLSEMGGRGEVKEMKLDELTGAERQTAPEVDEIFAKAGDDRATAARLALKRVSETGNAEDVIDAARILTFLKGNDAHDYKFSSAALEDYYLVSPEWRNRFLASSMFMLNNSAEKDNRLVERTRQALKI